MIVRDGLAARTGAPFWRWTPLPVQNCNPGNALAVDKTYLHALLEEHVILPCERGVVALITIDRMETPNSGKRNFTCGNLWAPDPGRVPDSDHTQLLITSGGAMATGQYNDQGLWIPFTAWECQMQYEAVSMGQMNAWGLWVPHPPVQEEWGIYLDAADPVMIASSFLENVIAPSQTDSYSADATGNNLSLGQSSSIEGISMGESGLDTVPPIANTPADNVICEQAMHDGTVTNAYIRTICIILRAKKWWQDKICSPYFW